MSFYETMTFNQLVAAVDAAAAPGDLFDGVYPPEAFRVLSLGLHPDRVADDQKDVATEAFAKMSALWDKYNGKVGPVALKTKRGSHPVGDLIAEGFIANVYRSGPNVVKMPRSPNDSDLMEREVKALRKLDGGNPDFRHFLPTLVETFRHKDEDTKVIRRVNVIEHLDGFHSLADIFRMFRDGMDPRDLAWIWRRLFVCVGQAYESGLVHGAVLPENIMIHPVNHGVVLIGWACSVDLDTDQVIPAVDPAYREWYPPYVFAKGQPNYSLDVGLMAHTMAMGLGANGPRRFLRFAQGCLVSNPPKPAELLAEFDELLDDQFGPRKYRELILP